MATKRTDPHRPGTIIPAHYAFVFAYNLATTQDGWPVPSLGVTCELDRRREWKDADGKMHTENGQHAPDGRCCILGLMHVAQVKFAPTGGTGRCSVCGAHFIYGDVWVHEPTGEHIHIGHECAAKYELLADRSAHEFALGRARQAAAVALVRERNREERGDSLAKYPGLEAALTTDHRIVRDIADRFQQFRALSDKQVALVFKLAAEAVRPPEEHEKQIPAPKGRVDFRGTVISLKSQESKFGSVLRMTVKVETPTGFWLAWGTAPAAMLEDAQSHGGLKGCKVHVTATLKHGDEPHFAIAQRPLGKVLIYSKNHTAADCFACLQQAHDDELAQSGAVGF